MRKDASVNVRVPFDQKWEIHKPLLERLYLEENFKLPKIKGIMRDENDFDAEVHQYKYRFKKWGWKKSVSSETKARIVSKSQQRLNAGQGAVVKYKTRAVDSRKLVRFEKAQRKKQTSTTLFAPNAGGSRQAFAFNGIAGDTITFMDWNLPYRALLRHFPQLMDHPSPSARSISTPSDVSIESPAVDAALSPGLSQAVNLRKARQNAALFVAGDFEGLLRAMSAEEKKVFSTWMYEFWYFGFVAAKHWGRGPKDWTVDNLWKDFQNATSPGLLAPTPPAHLSSLDPRSPGSERHVFMQASLPPPLCRWSIHIFLDEHGDVEWLDEGAQVNPNDALSQEWPDQWLTEPLEQKLQNGLESNSFSTIQSSKLPVDLGHISQAASKSPSEIWREGLGFAIMGRNFGLLDRMLADPKFSKRDTPSIYPAHLAATYLDGGKTCCQIMDLLLGSDKFDRGAFDRDSKGHTVLDALMLRILRSHSGTLLEVVDDNLRGVQGYAGEEVDICGRWDTESDSYRKLVGGGAVKVPLNWKHKFCHTSIQAICHCIEAVVSRMQPATSGLFLRRCFSCGLKLELQPLHTMVLVALQLLKNGVDGEDLFGMICCLFQLTVSSAYHGLSFAKSHVSTHLLQDGMNHDGCSHEELSPFELAMRVDVTARQCGSPEARKGWAAFVLILQRIEEQHRWVSERHPPPGYEEEHETILKAYEEDDDLSNRRPELGESLLMREIFHDGDLGFSIRCYHLVPNSPRVFGRNVHLGHVWAACQAELLAYRRQQESHPWLSQHITIDAILECLQTGDPKVLPHAKNEMLEPYCACGLYDGWHRVARREQACVSYFSNLDDWHRTSFIAAFDE
ncbi:hypothetical protein K458DRAFT_427949 [Lentithecium fluviatile CBS 122367]|uniref:Clr5 domain-containing protein n=1 Tax=Lentithecium fluviatile CBS 122367 TaxID=1168545 RepID=A0A6G1JDX9_9PLEO|nr:hypothetical protein K458DRAFT_427949 [Lentithecium fluviatile CBS 122367]